MMHTVLLIIASQGYQPLEYGYAREQLEKAGIKVVVASDKKGIACAMPSPEHSKNCDDKHCSQVVLQYPEFSSVQVDMQISDINVQHYDAIFLIGGPGALEYLDNQATYKIMQAMAQTGKLWGAICISPRILAKAGLLEGKKATGWNGDNKLQDIFKKYKVTYEKEPVVTDDLCITADGPQSAVSFGQAIVQRLKHI